MLDPELADAFVTMREREAIGCFRVREAGGVEVEAESLRLCPRDPVLEVRYFDLVPVHALAAELTIHGVEVQAVLSGDERERLLQIPAQLIVRACFAGVIARDGESAAEFGLCNLLLHMQQKVVAQLLEAADVVALPAVE